MERYLWIFPVLFIFHDMEEIVGMVPWLKKHGGDVVRRVPAAKRIIASFDGITTEGFALAVYEELAVLMAICAVAELTEAQFVKGVWLGGLIGFALHLVIHIIQSAVIRRYIPALITSLLTLPPSVLLIRRAMELTEIDTAIKAGMAVGIAGIAVNLLFAHFLMRRFSNA